MCETRCGSSRVIADADKVYTVKLKQDNTGFYVIAHNEKNRNGKLEGDEILYYKYPSERIVYIVGSDKS